MIEIPGYKIEKELGQGGMATVYLGVQEFVNRKVAIKIMSPSLASDPTFSERFIKEANCANLSHNHIITVYDAGCIDNHNYIVMEYIGGGDLSHAIEKGLSVDDAVRILKQIAQALAYSCDQGYVHRDVKPDNILFRDDGSAVLADFGIAKAASSSTQLTGVGKAIGSPHYMSPEQTRGHELDCRSDLYSLGIVFHEMLTGKKPYDATDLFAIGMMHVNEPIPQLPAQFAKYQGVLNKMLAKNRDERYPDMAAFIRDLDAVHGATTEVNAPGATVAMDAIGKTTVVDMSEMAASGGTVAIDANQTTDTAKSGSNKAMMGVAAVVVIAIAGAAFFMMGGKEEPAQERVVQQTPAPAPVVQVEPPAPPPVARPAPEPASKPADQQAAPVEKPAPAIAAAPKPKPVPKQKPKPKPDQTPTLLAKAQTYLDKGQLVKPAKANAFDTYQKVLAIKPGHQQATAKLKDVAEKLLIRARKAINAENLDDAALYLKRAKQVMPASTRVSKLETELKEARTMLAALADKQFQDKLSDGSLGPKMIRISAGKYRMGDIQQSNHEGGERPVHSVTIPGFSVGKYEVSYEEYDKFAKATSRPLPDDAGWGRGNRPVVNVSWDDAKAYTKWLSNESGGRYRLMTESEWEYVARAGSDKKYSWGNSPGRNKANCKGCGSKWDRKKTAPVGSFKANSFGLYDLHGNVWEWVEDCWNDTYQGAPDDGTAMLQGDCKSRVLRGGSWNNYPPFMRSANRDHFEVGKKTNMFGFRVAKDL